MINRFSENQFFIKKMKQDDVMRLNRRLYEIKNKKVNIKNISMQKFPPSSHKRQASNTQESFHIRKMAKNISIKPI